VSWYLRSTDDHDTHRGTMNRGSVIAVCGIRFAPRTVAFGRIDERRYHPRWRFQGAVRPLADDGRYPARPAQRKPCEACAGEQFTRAVTDDSEQPNAFRDTR
jgi:hypothetical protein